MPSPPPTEGPTYVHFRDISKEEELYVASAHQNQMRPTVPFPQKVRLSSKFDELLKEGLGPNEAAAKALRIVRGEESV